MHSVSGHETCRRCGKSTEIANLVRKPKKKKGYIKVCNPCENKRNRERMIERVKLMEVPTVTVGGMDLRRLKEALKGD